MHEPTRERQQQPSREQTTLPSYEQMTERERERNQKIKGKSGEVKTPHAL